MPGRKVLTLAYAAAVAVFLLSGGLLVAGQLQARRASAFYSGLTRLEEKTSRETFAPAPAAVSPADPLPEASLRVAALQEEWPDVKAWLTIDGTVVDYPVVQGGDNQVYLHTLPDGTSNPAGSIFLDCRCGPDEANLILYGHNARSGAMFGSLRSYLEEEYLEEHPEFSLFTPEGELRCRIFSVRRVDAYDTDAYLLAPPEGMDMTAYVRRLAEQSEVSLPAEDCERIVTLSTCTGLSPNQRLVVHAAVLPPRAADPSAA